jgi:hypothetical protein
VILCSAGLHVVTHILHVVTPFRQNGHFTCCYTIFPTILSYMLLHSFPTIWPIYMLLHLIPPFRPKYMLIHLPLLFLFAILHAASPIFFAFLPLFHVDTPSIFPALLSFHAETLLFCHFRCYLFHSLCQKMSLHHYLTPHPQISSWSTKERTPPMLHLSYHHFSRSRAISHHYSYSTWIRWWLDSVFTPTDRFVR